MTYLNNSNKFTKTEIFINNDALFLNNMTLMKSTNLTSLCQISNRIWIKFLTGYPYILFRNIV